jgi:hypothetical protein
MAVLAPVPQGDPWEHAGLHWLLERDLGPKAEAPLEAVAGCCEVLEAAGAEAVPVRGSLRELLRILVPQGLPRSARLVSALRAAKHEGVPLPFAPRQASIDRALDQPLELELLRGWSHGALRADRVLEHGLCHWRHLRPDGWLGADRAPFAAPLADDPALCLHILAWSWRFDPPRAADALVALGLVDPAPPRWVDLSIVEPHPCLTASDLERLLGVAPGRVSASDAATALGRGQGLVVAGVPLRLRCKPGVRPRRGAAPWRIRDRDPRRLFSRWHEGVRLDPEARASVSPEAAALATARRMGAERVVDAFCGAGGNAIAFARMPWCREVVAVELCPERLEQARHNARIYGVQDRIRFVQGDFLELAAGLAEGATACFLDPPWARGPVFAAEAWRLARAHFPRGAMKQARQDPAPPGSVALEAIFGVGAVVSWVQAWWGEETSRES